MNSLFEFSEKYSIVATLVLVFVCYLTGYTIGEMMHFAQVEPPSLERAAVIAAVLTPVSGLMSAAIAFYNKRKENNVNKIS